MVEDKTLQPLRAIQGSIDSLRPGTHIVDKALAHIKGLEHQEVPQERRSSYFCDQATLASISRELGTVADSLNCDVLYSAGLYLDILPKGINKGRTLRLLIEHLNFRRFTVLHDVEE